MRYLIAIVLLIFLSACSPATEIGGEAPPVDPIVEPIKGVMGETIYVPIYSHIYFENRTKNIQLAATLSVRNTDPKRSIQISEVTYYDTEGKLLRKYLRGPIELKPLASRAYIVERPDRAGGSGANFIVKWTAAEKVSAPVVEAIMISADLGQGISFPSVGRVIDSYP